MNQILKLFKRKYRGELKRPVKKTNQKIIREANSLVSKKFAIITKKKATKKSIVIQKKKQLKIKFYLNLITRK